MTAPPGAVAADTAISVSRPEQLTASQSAPLLDARTGLVRFDISLAGGVEPARPLELIVRLQGDLLPRGAKPDQALLYTADPHGGYELVPATVDASGTLHARLDHLSPKFLAFPNVDAIAASLGIKHIPAVVPNCTQSAKSASGSFLVFGSGWTNQTGSQVTPCLRMSGQQAQVTIINHTSYMWPFVTVTKGATVDSPPDDPDQYMTQQIANVLYLGAHVSTYLWPEGTASLTVNIADMPAGVVLQGSAGTILAQAAWIATGFIYDLVTGQVVKTLGAAKAVATQLFATPRYGSCIEGIAKQALHDATVMDLAQRTILDCGSVIAEDFGEAKKISTDWLTQWAAVAKAAAGWGDLVGQSYTAVTNLAPFSIGVEKQPGGSTRGSSSGGGGSGGTPSGPTPTSTPTGGGGSGGGGGSTTLPGPSFVYPVDGQTLDLEGDYLLKVNPVPNATGYLYGFFQDGVMVWENYRDEGVLSGTEYGIAAGSVGHSKFHEGDVQIWARGYVNNNWTDATIITIHLRPRA